MAGDYDGAPAVILSAILAAALAFAPQEPSAPFTVASVGDHVPAKALAAVERHARDGLAELKASFPMPVQPFRIFVHDRSDSLAPEVRAALHEGSPGLALLERQEIHLVLDNLDNVPGGLLRPVVVHELVHLLLHQYAAPHGGLLPRWLHEGLAQHLAKDTWLGVREEDLIWRVGSGRLLAFDELAHDFPRDPTALRVAYAQSYSYVAWLVRQYGLGTLLEAARTTDPERSFLARFVRLTGRDTAQLRDGWTDYLVYQSGARYRVLLDSCFPIAMVLSLPLLALAMMRRMSADRRARQRLEGADRAAASPADADAAAVDEPMHLDDDERDGTDDTHPDEDLDEDDDDEGAPRP